MRPWRKTNDITHIGNPKLIIGGWTIFAHPIFLNTLEALTAQVAKLQQKDPSGYTNKNATKRLAAINKLAFEIIPKNPARPEYRQGERWGMIASTGFAPNFSSNTVYFFATTKRAKSLFTLGSTTKTPSAHTAAMPMPTALSSAC